MPRIESARRRVRLIPALLLTLACGGDSAGTVEPTPVRPSEPTPTTVVVTPADTTLIALGRTARLTATVRDQRGGTITGAAVTWSSSATAVAVVDAAGLVTAVANGTAGITARAGGASGSARVTVRQAASSVVVSPTSIDLEALGDTIRATATASDGDGHAIDGVEADWSSDNPDVARVDSAGLVTAVADGTATITATVGAVRGSAAAAVRQVPVSMEVTGRRSALAKGDSLQLTATVHDANGHPVAGLALQWSSSDPSIATVDQEGWVVGVAEGSAEISAASGQLRASKTLSVLSEADLMRGALVALYESTGGPNWKQSDNWLSDAPLEDWYGVSTDSEGSVTRLVLVDNGLEGTIPPEVGHLKDLRDMWLYSNELRGALPPELGNLSRLRQLGLSANGLSGELPAELGRLANLTTLWLPFNDLSGPIPPAIGDMESLEVMWLYNNNLSGSIPTEIGKLTQLTDLQLHANELTGVVPPEFGDLSALRKLWLYRNRLSGSIPPELGNLTQLEELSLHENRLRGAVPPALGKLTNLTRLQLNDNPGLSGLLPLELAGMASLTQLLADATSLCAPNDPGFRSWLTGLTLAEVAPCRQGGAPFYLIQAVQSPDSPVPLVAGRDALLRVFPVALQSTEERIPPVRASFYHDDALIHTLEIAAGSEALPTEFADGPLTESANGVVPGSVLRPGVEMVVEVDPDTTVTLSLGVHERIPETGSTSLEVYEMPPLELTILPFLWRSDPDTAFARRAGELTAGHESLWDIRYLLPIDSLDVRIREAVWTDLDPVFENSLALVREVEAIRLMDRSRSYYMGMLRDGGGQGYIPGKSSVSELVGNTMAHELAHNLSLSHAPCGVSQTLDPRYPHERGAIGARGYDARNGGLIPPQANDLMGYCQPRWISDYHFTRATEYRLRVGASAAPDIARTRTLLLWGGVRDGVPFLDPSFVVQAMPHLPSEGGPYRLEGISRSGKVFFSLGFRMPAMPHGDPKESGFVFALPVPDGWDDLERITLSGPDGTASLDRGAEALMALLLDESTGEARGFLRDLAVAADGAVPVPLERGLRVQISRGVPDMGGRGS